jgi:hypothetical protein
MGLPTTDQTPPPAAPDQKKALGGDALKRDQPPLEIPEELAQHIQRAAGVTGEYRADMARTVVPVLLVKDMARDTEDHTRTGTPYRVIVIDLSVARDHIPLQGTIDMVMSLITLTQLSPSGTFRLHVGERDGILFGGSGLPLGSAIDLETPEQTRLSITNVAQAAGQTAELTVGVGRRIP